jgi:hypothetical protein
MADLKERKYRIPEIKALLRGADYAPVVTRVGDGVIARMPDPKMIRPGPDRLRREGREQRAYAFRRGTEAGIYFNSSTHPDEQFVGVPEHAIRLFVMADISLSCGRVPISDRVICYVDDEGAEHDHLADIVDPPSTDEERNKEGFLATIFAQARGLGFPTQFERVALDHGVYAGYMLVKSFFKG